MYARRYSCKLSMHMMHTTRYLFRGKKKKKRKGKKTVFMTETSHTHFHTEPHQYLKNLRVENQGHLVRSKVKIGFLQGRTTVEVLKNR